MNDQPKKAVGLYEMVASGVILTQLRRLYLRWGDDMETYPATGLRAAGIYAAIKLCREELRVVILDATGIDIAQPEEPA